MEQGPDNPRRRGVVRRITMTVLRVGVIVAALVAIGGIMNIGERLAYHPTRSAFTTPPGYEDVWFEAEDGVRLHGWFMPTRGVAAGEPAPVVVHAHGNAGHVAMHEAFSSFLTEHGVHVLLFDYRGYGRSDDVRPARPGLLADTNAALAYARTRPDVDPDRIGVFGSSLGGAFATHAAAEDGGVRAVATLSAFSTWRGVAHDWIPVVGPVLIRAGLDPVDAMPGLAGRPYLIVHGDADRVIRVRHAERLRESAAEAGVDVRTVVVPGADHNRIIDEHDEARDAIAAFFVEHLRPDTTGQPEGAHP